MEKKRIIVLLTHIKCVKSTSEVNHDDVYFHIYSSHNGAETSMGVYFWNNTLKMNGSGDNNADINVELGINLDFVDELRVSIRDKDETGSHGESSSNWDLIGDAKINRNSPIDNTIRVVQTTGHAEAIYELTYRIIYKPIPTLRVHGIFCEVDSTPGSGVLIDEVISLSQDCCDKAADAMKYSPRPRAKAMKAGFKAASKALEVIGNLSDYIANALEGPDEVYMQITEGGDSVDGGAFFPPTAGYYQMKSEEKDANGEAVCTANNTVFFEDKYGKYFRFPLDKGDVTIQIKDKDHGADDCIGALTINETKFNELKDKDGQVEVAAESWGNDNQGAVYHICYSVGMEDWAKPATADGQGSVEPPENLPKEGVFYSIVNKYSGKVLCVEGHSKENNGNIAQIVKIPQNDDQRWRVQYDESRASIINELSEKVICVQGFESGNNAVQMSRWDYDDQRWYFGDAGDGYVYIVNASSGKYLNVAQYSKEDWANVIQWDSGDYDNQKWKFVKAP